MPVLRLEKTSQFFLCFQFVATYVHVASMQLQFYTYIIIYIPCAKDIQFCLSSRYEVLTVRKGGVLDPTQVKQLSWNPRVFLHAGFLSDEECDHLISVVINI